MKKAAYTFLILFAGFCTISAQSNNESPPTDRIYLHTDRSVYIAGENLFYTLYLKGNSAQMSKYAYLVIRNHNNTDIIHARLEINNSIAYGNTYLSDTLSTGTYQLVCYTNCMRNGDEISYFRKEIMIANRFDEKLELFTKLSNSVSHINTSVNDTVDRSGNENLIIQPDKKTLNPREKISFSILSNSVPGNAILHLSVSISEIIPGIPFGSDISAYFNSSSKATDKKGSELNQCRFYPEIKGPILQGSIIKLSESNQETDSIAVNAGENIKRIYTVLVATTDSVANMQVVTTDSLGIFRLLLNPYYDGRDLIIRLRENIKASVILDDKFSINQHYSPSSAFNVPGMKDYILRSSNIFRIRKIYNEMLVIDTLKRFLPSEIIPRIFYDHYTTIYPSDYLELNDFVEISREIVPAFKIRKNKDKYVSSYLGLQDQSQKDKEPAIFLDGVPIDDVNQIINLGSNRISRIESIPVNRFYGNLSFTGILAIFSRDNSIGKIKFKTPTIKYQSLSSQSYTRPEPFSQGEDKRIPDLRQLLLWEPDLTMKINDGHQIECYASDLPGQYRIDIQGISSDGRALTGSSVITIKTKQ
jgi:hypothetical protein